MRRKRAVISDMCIEFHYRSQNASGMMIVDENYYLANVKAFNKSFKSVEIISCIRRKKIDGEFD